MLSVAGGCNGERADAVRRVAVGTSAVTPRRSSHCSSKACLASLACALTLVAIYDSLGLCCACHCFCHLQFALPHSSDPQPPASSGSPLHHSPSLLPAPVHPLLFPPASCQLQFTLLSPPASYQLQFTPPSLPQRPASCQLQFIPPSLSPSPLPPPVISENCSFISGL